MPVGSARISCDPFWDPFWDALCDPLPPRSWNFTSSMRAVLSARSRCMPMRRKYSASSSSMVPMVTPRARCERNFTHSKNSPGLRSSRPVCRCLSSSSQVVL
ncbi:hypothetical protein D3C72_2042880 [compost metagenome]